MYLLNKFCLAFFPIMTLNIFDDIKDGIEQFLKDLTIDGIKNQFSYIINLLSSGLGDSGEGIGGTVNSYLQTSPANIDSGLWSSISALASSTIVPIALTIVAIISVSDMFMMVTSGNNMRDFDTSIFFKWIVKTEIALTLVSHSVSFVELVFAEGAKVCAKAIGLVGPLASSVDLNTALSEMLKDYSLSKLMIILVLSAVTMLAVYALFITILIVLCSRTIEAVMYLSIAPIPMATFMNSDFRQVGNAWARGIFALAFQAFFIIVALAFFKSMFNDVINGIQNKTDILWSMTKMAGYSIALIFTVLRTGQISKTMFSAH